jgi:transcriptional regulator of nitric oxide reductase
VAEEAEVDEAIGAQIEVVGEHLMMIEAIAIPAAGLKRAAGEEIGTIETETEATDTRTSHLGAIFAMTVTVTVTAIGIVIVTTASYSVTNKRPGHLPRQIQRRSREKCHRLPWRHLLLHLAQFLTEVAFLAKFPPNRLSSSRTASDQPHLAT